MLSEVKTKAELEVAMECSMEDAKRLFDSPISLSNFVSNQIGFYQGFCVARDWDTNLRLIMKWESLVNLS